MFLFERSGQSGRLKLNSGLNIHGIFQFEGWTAEVPRSYGMTNPVILALGEFIQKMIGRQGS